MKPTQHLKSPRSKAEPAPLADPSVRCDVMAHGAIRATEEMLPLLRQKPGPPVGEPLPTSFLKNADDQTVAGITAVFKAIHEHGLAKTCFTNWGVLAAPRFLGRTTLAASLKRFAEEGAWGISPHLIPHRSLHSISGTVSQALKIHGPNFGVGGGPGCAVEAIQTAAAMVAGEKIPGVWVVLTGWDPEPDPNIEKQNARSSVCNALALALTAPQPGWLGPRLRLVSLARSKPGLNYEDSETLTLFGLETLLAALTGQDGLATTVIWQLSGGQRLELERPRLAVRQGDKETGRQGDKETGRQGDKETGLRGSPCLPVSLSPCLDSGAGTEKKL